MYAFATIIRIQALPRTQMIQSADEARYSCN